MKFNKKQMLINLIIAVFIGAVLIPALIMFIGIIISLISMALNNDVGLSLLLISMSIYVVPLLAYKWFAAIGAIASYASICLLRKNKSKQNIK